MEALEPLIVKHIRPGSVIISDSWSAYNNKTNLHDSEGNSVNYTHKNVNHRIDFVNHSDPSVHTQTVERFWNDLNDKIKYKGRCRTIEQNLYKYLFQRKYKDNIYHHLLVECGEYFPFEEQD